MTRNEIAKLSDEIAKLARDVSKDIRKKDAPLLTVGPKLVAIQDQTVKVLQALIKETI